MRTEAGHVAVSGPEDSEPVALYAILQRRLDGSITGSEMMGMALIELTGTFCKSCISDTPLPILSLRCCRIAPFDSGNPCSHVRAQTWHWQDGSGAARPVHFAGPVRAAGFDEDGGTPLKPCCQADVIVVPSARVLECSRAGALERWLLVQASNPNRRLHFPTYIHTAVMIQSA